MSSVTDFIHIYQEPAAGSNRVLLALHGTGGDERSLVPLAQVVDPLAGILSVKGQVSENGAPRFFRRLAEGVFDLADLHARTQELADFIALASNYYKFDLNRLIAVGYSNGANIAASLLLSRPEILSGAILIRAMVPFEPDNLNDLSLKQIFISEGNFDPIVPKSEGIRLETLFRERGAQTTMLWNDIDHRISKAELDVAKDWLAET